MNKIVCPSFQIPPVVETVLSIQFDELRQFRSTHFGMYHALIKDRYPIVEDSPRLEPVIESFPRVPRMPALRLTPNEGGPDRVWFRKSDNGSTMLQLQPDRFAFNWCQEQGQEYPRYQINRPTLFNEFEKFSKFAESNELGEVNPNLCEVTYVNHIYPKNSESVTECFASVFSGLDWKSSDDWLPQPPEIVTFNRVFIIDEDQGRLYVEAGIANDKTIGDFILLKITARVAHHKGNDLIESLDLAHLWVVKSFVSLTDEQARIERWKQKS